jgi:hypothetical protein
MGLDARGALVAVLVAGVLAACAAPSRRLPLRVVDDPVVLPRGMAAVELSPYARWYPLTHAHTNGVVPELRLALGNRVELDNLSSVRVALLDDAPGSPLPASRLSLAVQAGVFGTGYSSEEGWIVYPTLSVTAAKHIAGRWRLSAYAEWDGYWVQKPLAVSPGYDGQLFAFTRRASVLTLGLAAVRQLTERVALRAAASASQWQNCVAPFCAWASRGAGAALLLYVRPWNWITLSAGPTAGLRYRPLVLPSPASPETPVSIPPQSVGWYGVAGALSFYW